MIRTYMNQLPEEVLCERGAIQINRSNAGCPGDALSHEAVADRSVIVADGGPQSQSANIQRREKT
ncbi:hypothetical protein AAVH_43145 [Aphelenchoides avenae]|nr:hypothetical protein AAVH_43145 [Aphelenchus avenae]